MRRHCSGCELARVFVSPQPLWIHDAWLITRRGRCVNYAHEDYNEYVIVAN